jgi:hypothetical protein
VNSLGRTLPLLALNFFTAASSRGMKLAIPQTARLSASGCNVLCFRRFHRSVPAACLQVAKPNPGPKDDGASKALMH